MTPPSEPLGRPARLAVLDAANRMAALGLNRGMSGNVSLRQPHGFLITPSGMLPSAMTARDIVGMTMEGGVTDGRRKPSSEWRFHRDIYAAHPAVCAIVHGHPPFCVALASHRRAIPAYHYMVAKAGGDDIRCADYATYGTQELSANALLALQDRQACLLANHGMIATGPDLAQALQLAVEVEELAEGYWRALQLGPPVLLDAAEMRRVLDKFSHYGVKAQSGAF